MKSSTCYLYVLPLAYENILKVGISGDPLVRAQAFSRRYYECFDLPRSLLVEFDSKREAQARETELHRQLRPLNATQPLTIPAQAAGETEWYRGAYALLCDEVGRDRRRGTSCMHPASPGGGNVWARRAKRCTNGPATCCARPTINCLPSTGCSCWPTRAG